MPTYEYRCNDCGKTFEAFQKITEDALKQCPHCGGEHVQRLISPTAFHLKGSGWYKTDYGSSSSGGSSSSSTASSDSSAPTSSSTEAPKTETKTESKPAAAAAKPAEGE